MNRRKLYVGLDIRDDVTQLAVLGPENTKPEILFGTADEEILTEVSVPGSDEVIRHFMGRIVGQEPIEVAGKESDPVNVLAAFLSKTLSLTKKKYPQEAIRKLVVTIESRDFRVINMIYQALEKLGIEKDRAMVVDRRQAYVYYVLSQPKDYWVNQVGLFDYCDNTITYYQMQADRFKRPMLATVNEKDYSDYVSIFQGDEQSEEEKSHVFEGMVQGAIHGQIITSLYMIGNGFANGFADDVMKKLCVGRHLFQGDNLYVTGACYCARETGGGRSGDEFVYLDEDTISSHVIMQVYTDAKVQDVALAKAGTPWYQIDHEIDLIPDGDEELEIRVKNVVTKEIMTHLIPMEAVMGRLERKVRVGLQIRFAGPEKCILTLRDKGFGESYPSTFRIWEETIML